MRLLLLVFALGCGITVVGFLRGEEKSVPQVPHERDEVVALPDSVISASPSVLGATASESPTASPVIEIQLIDQHVPFMAQAPQAQWNNPHFQDACEEAASLMAMAWVGKSDVGSAAEATIEIQKLVDYQIEKDGEFRDRSSQDLADLMVEYFEYADIRWLQGISLKDVIRTIQAGNIVIVPANGQALANQYFTPPGPDRHMLLLKGYDPATKEFITNDPGTRLGADFRYDQDVLFAAIRDYPTGDHAPIIQVEKNMIVIGASKNQLLAD